MAEMLEHDSGTVGGAAGSTDQRPPQSREQNITEAFVSIARSLAEGYDLVELYIGLTSDCARILDVGSAGLLLVDPAGVLQIVAASSERTRDLELYMLGTEQGPCLDCYRTGAPVSVPDLEAAQDRWPRFAPVAVQAGFAAVHAVPMRLQENVLGTLGLFSTRVGALGKQDLDLAHALAQVASIALVAGRAAADKTIVNAQLQSALESRVVLEQAKGVISQLGDLDMAEAFAALRRYSRDHNEKLSEVAGRVVRRGPLAEAVLLHARRVK